MVLRFCVFKQKTAYEMRISDWSSDVCSSDLEETDVRKTRFSEEQIIAVLREQEGGMKTADVCRKHGISSATLYAWKAKYGGMDVSQARKLKVLEEENARLKRLLADAMLDNRSEEHTSELQSLMRISYAVFCLKKKKTKHN